MFALFLGNEGFKLVNSNLKPQGQKVTQNDLDFVCPDLQYPLVIFGVQHVFHNHHNMMNG